MKITRKTFDEVMVPCYAPQQMVLKYGNGCYLYDTDDNQYLDLTAGIAVNCLGHNHPGVVKTLKKQAKNLIHCCNIFVNTSTLTLAKKLVDLTGYEKVFFANSGAESNEAALKLARRVAFDEYGEDKNEIISFNHSFHGRTFFSVSVGGQSKYSDGFGPKPAAITHLPYNDLETLKKTISDKTCAVILETIQGEGGILEGDKDFIQGVRKLCDEHHALMIFDEVQTGVGRTGTFLSLEQFGVRPDVVTMAKGLAAGVPIGCMLTLDKYAKHFGPGVHGTTCGGSPLACAVGSYVVDTVSDPKFLAKVRDNGELLRTELGKLNAEYDIFKEIRGRGLLIGAELKDEFHGKAGVLQKLCAEHGLLTLVAGPDVLRMAPPLIISKSEIKEAISLLTRAVKDFKKQMIAEVASKVDKAAKEAQEAAQEASESAKKADKAAKEAQEAALKSEKDAAVKGGKEHKEHKKK